MNSQTESIESASQPATSTTGLPRCSHRTPKGRHCRAQARDSRSGLCPRHYFRPPDHQPDPSLASELLGPITQFQSTSDVTNFLSRLLILQAQDRISPRRAAVMAYTCNLLLRAFQSRDLEAPTEADIPHHPIIDMIRSRGRRPAPSTLDAQVSAGTTGEPDARSEQGDKFEARRTGGA
jgi:hypothetical protein